MIDVFIANELFARVDMRLSTIWSAENRAFCLNQTKVERWDVFTYPDLDGIITFMVPGGSRWTTTAEALDRMTDEEIVQWIEVERAASLIAGG